MLCCVVLCCVVLCCVMPYFSENYVLFVMCLLGRVMTV